MHRELSKCAKQLMELPGFGESYCLCVTVISDQVTCLPVNKQQNYILMHMIHTVECH